MRDVLITGVMLATIVVTAGAQPAADESTSSLIAAALRAGRYAEVSRLIDGVLAKERDNGLRNIGDLVRGRPDMHVKTGMATFTCDVSTAGLRLAGSANGQPVSWLFDTGANFSVISDAEATRLGMTIHGSSARAGDLAGGSIPGRTATAERLTIGSAEMRDVTFLVTPASEMPFAAWPPGQQAILGLPVALALERVSWTSQGSCTVGRPAGDAGASLAAGTPLSFDRLFVAASVIVGGKALPFTLDTGNQAGTQLWPRFGREFPQLVARRGVKGTARVTQIGGAADHPTTVISDLLLKIGGMDVTLRKVHLFSPPIGHESSYGLLGVDVFAGAREVTIDFHAMRVVVR